MALRLVVSALVLTWGTLPPALRHAHSGGRITHHSHDRVASYDHGHSQSIEHDEVDYSSQESGNSRHTAAGDRLVHLHWDWLGFKFSMPAPDDGDREEDGRGFEPLLVRLVSESPTICHNGDGPVVGGLDVSRNAGTSEIPMASSPARRPNLIASLPLCDSARLERSGVLTA